MSAPQIVPTPAQIAEATRLVESLGIDELAEMIAKAEAYNALTETRRRLDACPPFPLPSETFVCPDEPCATTIPQAHVFNEWPKCHPVRRIVTAHCPGCEKIWEAVFVLSAGVWQVQQRVRLVTRPAKVRAIQRQVAERSGTLLAQSA
jgi:hypothetical protein